VLPASGVSCAFSQVPFLLYSNKPWPASVGFSSGVCCFSVLIFSVICKALWTVFRSDFCSNVVYPNPFTPAY